jgi:hypothetical protein
MMSLNRIIVVTSLSIIAAPFAAVGQDAAEARVPWAADDLDPEKTVKWVYEGCAAYPVTVEDAPSTDIRSQLAARSSDGNTHGDQVSGAQDPVD